MSRPSDNKGGKPISDVKELAQWLEAGCTKKEDLLIGTENEKIIYDTASYDAVEYDSAKNGMAPIFERLQNDYGWQPDIEAGKVIGLRKDGASISLEPAGQFELSGAPLKNLHQMSDELDTHLKEMHAVLAPMDAAMLGVGYHPVQNRDNLPRMPKSRYENFQNMFKARHLDEAIDMMVCTSTCQVNLGFKSEEDMVKKLRVGLALQPIAVALFANSPFADGKPTGYQSYRSHLIQNNIEGRYGFMLPVAFEEGFGFERYADYALNEMPLLGIYQGNEFVGVFEKPFKDFMEGKLDICMGQKATIKDWENHLNCIWPEVRLRQFLEMRGADCGDENMIKALPAFWTGILYDDDCLDQAYEMIKDWDQEDREYLRTMSPMNGLQTVFKGRTVQDIAQDCLALSERGLKNRGIKNENGQDESTYLEPLHEIAATGRNLAVQFMEKYEGEWNRDITKLFDQYRMDRSTKIFVPNSYKQDAPVHKAPAQQLKPKAPK